MVWFAISLLIGLLLLDGGMNVLVEARRRQSRNNNNNRRMHQPPQRQHPAANRNRLRSNSNYYTNNNDRRNGYSPNLDAIYDKSHNEDTNNKDNNFYIKSFYKRNNMNKPPLISRAERYKQRNHIQQQRRVLQTQDNGSNILTIPDSPIVNSETTTNNEELDDIIEISKLGLDSSSLLRNDLIFNGYYDRHSYPWEYQWYNQTQGTLTGIPIELSINYHRVFSVDVIHPVLDLVVWLRIEWVDPRLTWDPLEYGNLTKIWMWIGDGGSGGETSEIWTPDIELWNLEEGLRDSFDDAYAIVSNDGSIYWSRPGHLRPVCKWDGLTDFPFDELSCSIEFGSWAYSGKYMRLVKGGGTGFSLGGSETAGSSFNEFDFTDDNPISCEEVVYPPFPASPEEDWPVLLYTVRIQRSWQPYMRGYVTLQVLLNCIGFSAFWLPPMCGERMSLSITAMLAAVASEIVIAANLPAAAEYTWFQKFSILSMCFAFISLLESVAVLHFYYKRSKDMIPGWWQEFKKWRVIRQAQKQAKESVKRTSDLVHEASHNVQQSMQETIDNVQEKVSRMSSADHDNDKEDDKSSVSDDQFIDQALPVPTKETSSPQPGSCESSIEPNDEEKKSEANIVELSNLLDPDDEDSSVASYEKQDKLVRLNDVSTNSLHVSDLRGKNNSPRDLSSNSLHVSDLKSRRPSRNRGQLDDSKNYKFDSSNVSLDHDFGIIQTGKTFADSMISNISIDDALDVNQLQPSRRRSSASSSAKLQLQDTKHVNFSNQNIMYEDDTPLRASLSLHKNKEANKSSATIDSNATVSSNTRVPRDADDFINEEEIVNNREWRVVAARIDDVARFWIPMAFVIALAIVLAEVF